MIDLGGLYYDYNDVYVTCAYFRGQRLNPRPLQPHDNAPGLHVGLDEICDLINPNPKLPNNIMGVVK